MNPVGPLDDDVESMSNRFRDPETYRFQRSVYACGDGEDARHVLLETVRSLARGDLLEVGCGEGEFASTAIRDGWRVTALDSSRQMISRAIRPGLTLAVGALPRLPIKSQRFDCVVAAWVLHYLPPDLVQGALIDMLRVLRPGGALVLATNCDAHMQELWRRVRGARYQLTFSAENAGNLLAPFADDICIRSVEGTVTFREYGYAKEFVANQLADRKLADRLEPFSGPLSVRRRSAVITARRRVD